MNRKNTTWTFSCSPYLLSSQNQTTCVNKLRICSKSVNSPSSQLFCFIFHFFISRLIYLDEKREYPVKSVFSFARGRRYFYDCSCVMSQIQYHKWNHQKRSSKDPQKILKNKNKKATALTSKTQTTSWSWQIIVRKTRGTLFWFVFDRREPTD